MNILILGAGEIGSHAAEIMASAGRSITVIDSDEVRLRQVADTLDVATFEGNGARADVLRDAGAAGADLVLAATNSDEVNLLAASVAKQLGARRTIARVHASEFYQGHGFDYARHLAIDRLVCPEYATALAIARRLRNPGAVAIEHFARGRIEMQEFIADEHGTAIGKRLLDVNLPAGTRLALIRRNGEAYIPDARSVVVAGDSVVLVGNSGAFEDARRRFADDRIPRQSIVIMGGPPMAVWLCRALRHRSFSIRIFERNLARAQELSELLDNVTVINADPTDRAVFEEEGLSGADAFIAMLNNDEANIIAGVLAKTRGALNVITVVQKSKYLDVVYDIGVDAAFSTRQAAVNEIAQVIDASQIRHVGSLGDGDIDVLRLRIPAQSPAIGQALRELPLSPDWVVAAVQRDRDTFVPAADHLVRHDDILLVVGHGDRGEGLRRIFGIEERE